MADDKVPITAQGKKKLEEELKRLTSVERPAVVAAIEHARSLGDLSENADYSAAKEKQGFIEGRIQELNYKFSRLEVIDPAKVQSDKVVFGATVTLEDLDTERKVTYQIVGEDEANIKEGKINVNSPIAKALIGKSKGDDVTVQAPKGNIEYSVLKIEYK